MPLPELLGGTDICDQAERWGTDPNTLALTTLAAASFEKETGRSVRIISGFRSEKEQENLRRRGRPTAPDELSTHRSCPSTGIDVDIGAGPSSVLKATWGRNVVEVGLRWGGGSNVDPSGIPVDWNHVDMGPRRSVVQGSLALG